MTASCHSFFSVKVCLPFKHFISKNNARGKSFSIAGKKVHFTPCNAKNNFEIYEK